MRPHIEEEILPPHVGTDFQPITWFSSPAQARGGGQSLGVPGDAIGNQMPGPQHALNRPNIESLSSGAGQGKHHNVHLIITTVHGTETLRLKRQSAREPSDYG